MEKTDEIGICGGSGESVYNDGVGGFCMPKHTGGGYGCANDCRNCNVWSTNYIKNENLKKENEDLKREIADKRKSGFIPVY